MDILYLTDRLSHRGGAPHHLLDLVGVMARDHRITVAAADKDGDVVLPDGVRFERCSGLRHGRAHTGGLDKLPQLLSTSDIVHIQNVMNPVALRRASGPRTVVTIQDHRVFCPGPGKTLPTDQACDDSLSDRACERCIPHADRREEMLTLTRARLHATQSAAKVIVLSKYMAAELAHAGIHDALIVPPPVPAGPLKTTAGEHFMLAGRLVHHKGTDLAIQAFERAQPGCDLQVAGRGSAELGSATALGWLGREALRTALSKARALLFPARWQEPFGIVGVEALSVGTPVIAMSRGGMGAWTDVGTLVVDNLDQMATAITQLDRQPEVALELGRAGQAAVTERFSPARHLAAMKAVYEDL